MKSEVARLFVYQIEFNVSLFWSAVFLRCPPLHWSSITENISFKAKFTLSSSSHKVNFTDITRSILEESHLFLFF